MMEEPPASVLLGPGVKFAGYTLLGARSRGAMGIVYAGTETATGRPVAVKVLRHQALRFAHTFARERDALHALCHENVVRYVGHGETPEGLPYLVTEWLEGEDLEARLAKGSMPVADAVLHAVAVARALGAAHARGIVHRDVKPANIHIGNDGVTKLLDFGVAHLGTGRASAVAVGTALYMAPEQVRATGTVDARSDVYALGCVLFECLTGRPPFLGDRATVVLAKAIFEPAPRMTSLGVAVSPSLEALVARMLSKRAEDRPVSGEHAALLLADCAQDWHPEEVSAVSPSPKGMHEQRIGCVALVCTAPSEGNATTMADGEAPHLVARLSALADEYGVEVDGLVDGTLLVTARDLEPADQGTRIARFTAAVVSAFPASAAALATGSLGGATSSAIERAEDLLRRTPPGEVRACATTTRVLAGKTAPKNDDAPDDIVGRDDVVEALLDVTGASQERCALVLGEAGIGKTCLLHAVAKRLGSAGTKVLLVRGELHRAGSPFAPFAVWLKQRLGLTGDADDAEVLRASVARRLGPASDHHATALLRLLGAEHDEALVAGEAREPVARALLAFLVAEARKGGAVVMVDDAQWLDAASLRILELIVPYAREGPGVAVLVFGRRGRPHRDRTGRRCDRAPRPVIREANDLGLGYAGTYAFYLRGRALRCADRPDEAEIDLTSALASGGDDLRVRAQAHTELARLALERDDVDKARERADLAIELSATLPKSLPHALAVRAEIHLLEDEVPKALAAAERAAALTRADFPTGDDPSFVWRVYTDIVVVAGRTEAAAVAREAYAQLIARAARVGDDQRRVSFMALPDNLRILAHARAHGLAGEP